MRIINYQIWNLVTSLLIFLFQSAEYQSGPVTTSGRRYAPMSRAETFRNSIAYLCLRAEDMSVGISRLGPEAYQRFSIFASLEIEHCIF